MKIVRRFFWAGVFAISAASSAQQNLILIGGGTLHAPPLKRLGKLAKEEQGMLLVISWASSAPEEAYTNFSEAMTRTLGNKCPKLLFAESNLSLLSKYDFRQDLQKATGVFFTGGDQNNLMAALKTDPQWIPELKARYNAGVVFGGTSAGTAVVAENMLTGQGDETVIDPAKVVTAAGLGLLPGVLVDQHFIRRQRQNRLFSLLLRKKECFAFGVDEDNSVHVRDNSSAEVLGPGIVMTIDHCTDSSQFVVKLEEPGSEFLLKF